MRGCFSRLVERGIRGGFSGEPAQALLQLEVVVGAPHGREGVGDLGRAELRGEQRDGLLGRGLHVTEDPRAQPVGPEKALVECVGEQTGGNITAVARRQG